MSKIQQIKEALLDKACVKQGAFENTKVLFERVFKITQAIAEQLQDKKKLQDQNVIIEVHRVNEFEFHLKFGGDLLVFIMQSNIFAFPGGHPIYKSDYIKQDNKRSFFGQMLIYNFLADSFKYHRERDFGYLIERLFVNIDDHFYVEGMKNLNFSYPDIARNKISDDVLESLIEDAILISVETDLVMSSFQDNFKLTVQEKEENQVRKLGNKLGFRFSTTENTRG